MLITIRKLGKFRNFHPDQTRVNRQRKQEQWKRWHKTKFATKEVGFSVEGRENSAGRDYSSSLMNHQGCDMKLAALFIKTKLYPVRIAEGGESETTGR